ncbi:MAG: 30S ribosomal protein S15 [Holosporales bacterium]|nr:30S ribosomal protein S15 [Holosporales bacterium]
MSITKQEKQELIRQFATHDGDVGSPEVQVSILTKRIKSLTDHVGLHKKDFHTRRGLLMLVGKRRRLLDYLKRVDISRYKSLTERLSLRK